MPGFYFHNFTKRPERENLAHCFPYDVKLRLLAHSRSFLANQKARNAIDGAENLLKNNMHVRSYLVFFRFVAVMSFSLVMKENNVKQKKMMEMFRVDQLRKCSEFPLNFCGSIFSRVTGAILSSGVLYFPRLRPWQTRTHCCGRIVADTNVSPFARARNICCGHKFCVRDTKSVSDFVQKHFVSATNVSQFAQPISFSRSF